MIIKIKVKPQSGRQEIKKISENEYLVYLKKPPEDNRANLELIGLLKKYFSRNINIIKGLKSKNKLIRVGES
jgi:uncharacterized protein (TIGR00251 family)